MEKFQRSYKIGENMKDMELFSIGEEIMKNILNRGMDDCIIIPIHIRKTMIRFSNNDIDVIQNWSNTGIKFLATKNEKSVIGYIGNISKEGIDRILERTLKFLCERSAIIPEGKKFQKRYSKEKLNEEKMVDYVYSAINSSLKEGAERCAGVFTGYLRSICILSSKGTEGYDERIAYELNIRAFKGEMSGQGISCANSINKINSEEAGREAGIIASSAKEFLKWNEGKYRLLISPIVAANLVERLVSAASAFNVDVGLSCLTGKIGEDILSKKLTIIDDGLIEDGLNSRIFDDEGIDVRRNIIVDKGILKNYLHNSKTAKKFNTQTTGNAGWISPHSWNIIVESEEISFKEAMDLLKDGIYVTSNWYTRFQNYRTGDFSTLCRDNTFLIENGEIKGAIKGVRISDNLLRIFNSINYLFKERKWIKWWEVSIPTLISSMILNNVYITKAQGYSI
jgi:PmbA protein